MDDLQSRFDEAIVRSRGLSQRPSNEDLLLLYALYKQSTEGDVNGERPGGFDFKGIAKYDAWMELRGKPKEQAMTEYIHLVDQLHQQSA